MAPRVAGQAVYLLQVTARVCNCSLPSRELFQSRKLLNVEQRAEGYWSLFVTFFGDMFPFLQFVIVDTRDGTMLWRNGRRLVKEEFDGTATEGNGD